MKAFWLVIALLMAAGAVYVVAQVRQREAGPGEAAVAPMVGRSGDVRRTPVEEPKPAVVASRSETPAKAPEAKPVEPTVVKSVETPAPALPAKPFAKVEAPAAAAVPEPKNTEPKAADPAPAKTEGPASAEPAAPAADPLAAKIVTKEDGSMVIDEKYVMRGKGTAEAPYTVTWDQLLSAQDDYVPKEGRKKIPERISMLDGKWVEVTGYIAFPVMAESQDEALSMMNQWDGCCVGVPPTPYDAIEVRLKRPAEGNSRLTTYGAMKGKFKVDPHLVGGWLVGLYVMDSAAMTPQSYGGFAP